MLCVCDAEGDLPVCNGEHTVWQFNFKGFKLSEDVYASDSIELLKQSGIDFAQVGGGWHAEVGWTSGVREGLAVGGRGQAGTSAGGWPNVSAVWPCQAFLWAATFLAAGCVYTRTYSSSMPTCAGPLITGTCRPGLQLMTRPTWSRSVGRSDACTSSNDVGAPAAAVPCCSLHHFPVYRGAAAAAAPAE